MPILFAAEKEGTGPVGAGGAAGWSGAGAAVWAGGAPAGWVGVAAGAAVFSDFLQPTKLKINVAIQRRPTN